MTRQKTIVRLYNVGDPSMLQFATLTHSNLEDNIADFTGFDASFDEEFGDDYETKILLAQNFNSDYQVVYDQANTTKDVRLKMAACRKYFRVTKYFIEKAFANDPIVWDQFGFSKSKRVLYQPEKLTQFMYNLFETATSYQTQLVAADFTASHIAEIKTLADALKATNTTKDKKKGNRRKETNKRIKLLNDVFTITQRVCKAGKIIYEDEPAMYDLFVLPWGNEGHAEEGDTVYVGSLAYGSTINIPFPHLNADSMLQFEVHGPIPLKAWGSTEIGGSGEEGQIIPGAVGPVLYSFGSLSSDPNARYLNVSNTVGDPGSPSVGFRVEKVL